jgi:hypothetical protein
LQIILVSTDDARTASDLASIDQAWYALDISLVYIGLRTELFYYGASGRGF